MAINLCMRTVPEMRRKFCSGANGLADLNWRCGCMADGDNHAPSGCAIYKIDAAGPLGRKRDDAYLPACRVLPTLKLFPIGRTRMVTGMSAARAIFHGNERA